MISLDRVLDRCLTIFCEQIVRPIGLLWVRRGLLMVYMCLGTAGLALALTGTFRVTTLVKTGTARCCWEETFFSFFPAHDFCKPLLVETVYVLLGLIVVATIIAAYRWQGIAPLQNNAKDYFPLP